MARLGNRRDFGKAIAQYERMLAREFNRSVREVRQAVTVRAIRLALERANLQRVEQLLMTPGALTNVTEAMREVFLGGARDLTQAIPKNAPSPDADGGRLLFRFDAQDAAAQTWLANQSSNLVTQVVEEQREAIRAVVERGTRIGQNPNRTALDIVGRINRATGRREGGILGLTGQQTSWVNNAREELSDPSKMRQYLRRKRRDRRFDSIVKRALRKGRPVAPADIDKIVTRYSDRLLAYRGETIARTEAIQGFAQGRHQAMNQLVDKGGIPPKHITRTWDATGDRATRADHRKMDGQPVQGREEPFVAPDGSFLMHPGDSSLGAPAEQIINCRCYEQVEVNFIAVEAGRNG